MSTRSGIGFDVHRLTEGRALVLGGVAIPFDRGLEGHSDGDVRIHAVIDALLGGAALGDIGTHFPPGAPRFRGIASGELLAETLGLLAGSGWRCVYVDATIIAERPVLSPFLGEVKQKLATSLRVGIDAVNVKAKTTDGLGFLGRGEGVAALAVATLGPSI